MNQLTTKFDATTGESNGTQLSAPPSLMDSFARVLVRLGILTEDLDYHLIRASMVIIFLFFGYQKWFQYEADVLIPYISNGPLIFWLYSVFGVRGATWFLGASEWSFGALLFLGFWNKKLGLLGAQNDRRRRHQLSRCPRQGEPDCETASLPGSLRITRTLATRSNVSLLTTTTLSFTVIGTACPIIPAERRWWTSSAWKAARSTSTGT